MIKIAILIAAVTAVTAAGVIVLLCVGIAREDSDHSLRTGPVTRASAITRCMVGLYVRMPTDAAEDEAGSPDTRRRSGRRWPR